MDQSDGRASAGVSSSTAPSQLLGRNIAQKVVSALHVLQPGTGKVIPSILYQASFLFVNLFSIH